LKQVIILMFSSILATTAFAADGFVTGYVVKVKTHYVAQTRNVCEQVPATVQVQVPDQAQSSSTPNATGMVLGALAGGLVGHQIGNGSGNTAATLAGAAGGAYLGNQIANSHQQPNQPGYHTETKQVMGTSCHPVTDNVPSGYEVTYRYAGKLYTTNLPYDPGSTVRVGLTAE
jgi:uncharacterized protein YcfJ